MHGHLAALGSRDLAILYERVVVVLVGSACSDANGHGGAGVRFGAHLRWNQVEKHRFRRFVRYCHREAVYLGHGRVVAGVRSAFKSQRTRGVDIHGLRADILAADLDRNVVLCELERKGEVCVEVLGDRRGYQVVGGELGVARGGDVALRVLHLPCDRDLFALGLAARRLPRDRALLRQRLERCRGVYRERHVARARDVRGLEVHIVLRHLEFERGALEAARGDVIREGVEPRGAVGGPAFKDLGGVGACPVDRHLRVGGVSPHDIAVHLELELF